MKRIKKKTWKLADEIQSARLKQKEGKFSEAEGIYKNILARHPDNFDALHMIGTIYVQIGNYNHAIKYIKQALQINPKSAIANYNLGVAFRDNELLDEALTYYQKAIDLNPTFAESYYNLGYIFLKKGHLDEAINCYQKIVQINHDIAARYFELIVNYYVTNIESNPNSTVQKRIKQFIKLNRPIKKGETSKAKGRRLREGFFEKYCKGNGLDIGHGGDLLTHNCEGWEIEDGDAQYLQGLKDTSFDFVYSSHTLEHTVDLTVTLLNWWRVLKKGGYLILYLPHRDLYEKKRTLPSRWNKDHKHFFLIDIDETPDTVGLIPLIQKTLSNFEIIYAKECNYGHTITDPEIHSDGEYSIEILILKRNDNQ